MFVTSSSDSKTSVLEERSHLQIQMFGHTNPEGTKSHQEGGGQCVH